MKVCHKEEVNHLPASIKRHASYASILLIPY
jgi:hypothetical protein